ncbi:MAG TPA: cytochrome c [Nitrospiraceae bacterium]|nr:cytochrome c [Nitrospiraceae bacterium]
MKDSRVTVLFFLSCFFVAGLATQFIWAATGDAAKGKIIYDTNCLPCHGERGKGDGPVAATLRPSPTPLISPKTRVKSDGDLLTIIRDGRAVMPAWKNRLKDQDIQDVLAYIRSLSE